MFNKESFIDSKKRDLFEALLNSINREVLGEGGKTVEEMYEALQRGDYGHFNLASVVASILAQGGSVEHLRGTLPDKLIDVFAKCLKR